MHSIGVGIVPIAIYPCLTFAVSCPSPRSATEQTYTNVSSIILLLVDHKLCARITIMPYVPACKNRPSFKRGYGTSCTGIGISIFRPAFDKDMSWQTKDVRTYLTTVIE